MRIAVVSSFTPGYDVGLESSYVRALAAHGHTVSVVPLSTDDKPWPRGLSQVQELLIHARRQTELTRAVLAASPAFVLVVKGRGLFGDTVRTWRKLGIRVFNLFPDNPYEAAASGLAARTLHDQLRAVERVFVHDHFAVGQLRQQAVQAEYIRFARDPAVHQSTPTDSDGAGPDPIVFIGNPDRERIRYLRALVDLGLGLYGQWEWARLAPNDPLARCVRGNVQLGTQLARRLRSARLSVNILRQCQKTAHNMRTFEVPACGVCALSEASIGVQETFAPGREVSVFRTPEELRSTAQALLASPATVDAIALAGRARVEHETYYARAAELLSYL